MTEPLTEILRILGTTADRKQRMEIRTQLNRLVIQSRNDGLEEAAMKACYGCRENYETIIHLNTVCHRNKFGDIESCLGAKIRTLKQEKKYD